MKTIIIAITLMMTLFVTAKEKENTVYQDGKQAVTTVYSDVKSLAPKIERSIESLAKGLKVGAESIWDILVKQQLVWSIGYLILTISAIVNWLLLYRKLNPSVENTEFTVLERDMIGDVPNPKYDYYYDNKSEYKNDIRSKATIKGPIGKEFYNAPKQLTSEDRSVLTAIHILICCLLSVFSFINFPDMLTGFINPEFGAMKTITELALQLK